MAGYLLFMKHKRRLGAFVVSLSSADKKPEIYADSPSCISLGCGTGVFGCSLISYKFSKEIFEYFSVINIIMDSIKYVTNLYSYVKPDPGKLSDR
jgi:hypothetical protein